MSAMQRALVEAFWTGRRGNHFSQWCLTGRPVVLAR
jgi:hypothetical protein